MSTPTPTTASPRTGTGLALRAVTLSYPDGESRLTALDEVELTVAPGEFTAVAGPSGSGEFTAVAGPSGSGKSSLLAVAATLLRPDRGEVLVDGVDAGALGERERTALRRDRLGIVFQQSNLLASLTAVEQVLVLESVRGRRPATARARAEELLESVGLTGAKQRRRPHQLSGGERQRVNIARALFGSPSVLLVDEPTSALDHERGGQIVDLLASVTREHGTATVMVTHDRGVLDRVDRVLEMHDGRLSG